MRERIKHVIAKTFDIPLSDVGDDAELNTTPNWDSLGHMLLMLELEAEFGISIATEDMTNLLSLDLLEEYLQDDSMQPGIEDPGSMVQS